MSNNDQSQSEPHKRQLSDNDDNTAITCKCSGCGGIDAQYVGEQFTNMYAQLNAQNKLLQSQTQFMQEFMQELIPLLKKIDDKLK